MSAVALMHALAASRRFSALDRALARLLGRIAGDQDSPELALAALLVSQQTAEQHACVNLAAFAGTTVDADLAGSPAYPERAAWCQALRAMPAVIGSAEQPDRPLILVGERLYLARYWQYETALAEWVLARLVADPADAARLRAPAFARRVSEVFQQRHEQPDWQRTAAVNALAGRFSIISGGPGTGKTTTVARLLALLLEAHPATRVALAAPTGKAAARLKQALKGSAAEIELLSPPLRQQLQELPASTLHRLLGTRWGSTRFVHDATHPLPYDLILVDEASMIDLALMVKLMQAIAPSARLILLGDKDQLASVEAGSVLGDLCALAQAEAFSPARRELLAELSPGDYAATGQALDDCLVLLKTSWRFSGSGGIGQLARAIQAGDVASAVQLLRTPSAELSWRPLPPMALREARLNAVLEGYRDFLYASEPGEALRAWEKFMVLATLRAGPYGVTGLNRGIESLLQREGLLQPEHSWYHRRPVLITANDPSQQLYNGDVGVVWHGPQGPRVWFQTAEGVLRELVPARLGAHETAWAMTVHKSQGSEFERILLVLPDIDVPLLTRELIYTGLTRARKHATIWGDMPLLEIALARRIQRASGLESLLRPGEGT